MNILRWRRQLHLSQVRVRPRGQRPRHRQQDRDPGLQVRQVHGRPDHREDDGCGQQVCRLADLLPRGHGPERSTSTIGAAASEARTAHVDCCGYQRWDNVDNFIMNRIS